MTTAEERIKILKQVSEGVLSATDAAAMLAGEPAGNIEVEMEDPSTLKAAEATNSAMAIEVEEIPAGKSETTSFQTNAKKATWLHVRVSDLNTGKSKVKVNIPLRLMKFGIRLGSAFAPELADVDFNELDSALSENGRGLLVDVEDEDEGHHVQVYID